MHPGDGPHGTWSLHIFLLQTATSTSGSTPPRWLGSKAEDRLMTKPCHRKLVWAGILLYTAALSAQDAAVSFATEEAQGGPKPAAAANETADLAKATQNPVASLIS